MECGNSRFDQKLEYSRLSKETVRRKKEENEGTEGWDQAEGKDNVGGEKKAKDGNEGMEAEDEDARKKDEDV